MEAQRGSVICPRSHSKLVAKPGPEPVSLTPSLLSFLLHKPACDCPGLLPTSTKEEAGLESDLSIVSNLCDGCWVVSGMVTCLFGEVLP